ncbi:trehalase [Coxiella burnetii]|nr:trehalase [Coxiella burnetii CbuG_Q212]ATN66470.1 trehalase [Coxiella burnetii]OYK86517.1 trehalase [Coxiella burnetii]
MPNPVERLLAFDPSHTMETYIQSLWPLLTCNADSAQPDYSSLIPLPHPYVIPGGRFREIYYWDSYFTAEGLACSDQPDLVINMAKNLAHLIETIGHIPNGNRIYYRSCSQPPFFGCLIEIIAQHQGVDAIKPFVRALEKEYRFWMAGEDRLTPQSPAHRRVVLLDDQCVLNRYWDNLSLPRPESYREDVLLYKQSAPLEKRHLYRNIRAACESGWDFSSRWMRDKERLTSIYTTELVPVDLNAILYHMEIKLADYFEHFSNRRKAEFFQRRAERRKQAIVQYCWDTDKQFYFDYYWTEKEKTASFTLAAAFPLFFKLASSFQAAAVTDKLIKDFFYPGGLVTTLDESAQQWDKPNGWAPLHWIAIKGLLNYGYETEAKIINERWLALNRQVFQRTGKMMEKYNVCDPHLKAGGGEYPLQDGFGWTNGIAVALNALFSQRWGEHLFTGFEIHQERRETHHY